MLQSTQESGRKSSGKTAQVRVQMDYKKRLSVLALALNQNEGELVENLINDAWENPDNQYAVAILAGKEGA